MYRDPSVMLHSLVLSLSDSFDMVHPAVVAHHQRVSYASLKMAKCLGMDVGLQADIMYAAALHDIGILSFDTKVNHLCFDADDVDRHAELGANLLQRFGLFKRASEFVRYHHVPWDQLSTMDHLDPATRQIANILRLTDNLDGLIVKGRPILGQIRRIRETLQQHKGRLFSPELVECLGDVGSVESFWLDLMSPRIYSLLVNMIAWPRYSLTLDDLEQLGDIFSKVIDFRSKFTSTHSAGVASTAVALAGAFNFEKRERVLMRVAGSLHDLGKVAISNGILEKPGKLEEDEMLLMKGHTYYTLQILDSVGGFEDVRYWAAFHHERIDGRGYPFRLKGDDLSLGARIMAVADVFTAVAEDRPYRPGMSPERCLGVLNDMVASRALDGDVVAKLAQNFDAVNEVRRQAQAEHMFQYEQRFVDNCRPN